MKILFLLFITAIMIVLLLAQLRSAQTKSQPQQAEFLKGSLPSPLPSGFKKGDVNAKTNWLGKEFDINTQTGINLFMQNGKQVKQYPFKTYTGNGLTDPKLQVLKLDYNLPENPLYLRLVVDELVQITPGKYLGKLNVKLGPLTFALGFFRLSTH